MMIFQSQENPCQKNVKGKNVDYTVLYSKWYRNQELSWIIFPISTYTFQMTVRCWDSWHKEKTHGAGQEHMRKHIAGLRPGEK